MSLLHKCSSKYLTKFTIVVLVAQRGWLVPLISK